MPTTNASAIQTKPFADDVFALIVTESKLTQKYVTTILRKIIDLGNVQHVQKREDAIELLTQENTQHCSFIFYEDETTESCNAFIESLRLEKNTATTPIVVLGTQLPENYDPEHAKQQLTNHLQRPFIPSTLISLLFELFQEKDRRLAKRIDTNKLPCTVDMGYYATTPYQAEMLNISYTGCLVQTRHDFDDCGNIDDIGSLSFSTSEGIKIHLSGKIVRADTGEYHRIGFQFQNNEEQNLIQLGKLISSLSKQD